MFHTNAFGHTKDIFHCILEGGSYEVSHQRFTLTLLVSHDGRFSFHLDRPRCNPGMRMFEHGQLSGIACASRMIPLGLASTVGNCRTVALQQVWAGGGRYWRAAQEYVILAAPPRNHF